jgi:V/A-type H+-transporting ATPase subunit F
MSEHKVAVIGDRDSVLGFTALGAKVITPELEKVREAVITAVKEEIVVLFITERMAEPIPDLLSDLSRRPLPAVVVIPDASGSKGLGLDKLDEIIVRAVGSHLTLSDEKES